jgi:transposase
MRVRWGSGAELPRSIEILDFPGLIAVGEPIDDGEGTRTFIAVPTAEDQKACEKCGTNLYKHATRGRFYRDAPIRQYRVVIWLNARRYRCRSCKATFVQRVEGMDPTKSMTTRCVEWIRARCLRETFAHIAEEIGCDEKTVREIAHTYIKELNETYRPYLPEWLGIDETSLGGTNRCVLTDIGQRRPIELLRDREKETVTGWLYSFRDSSRLQGVTMDMWRPFKIAVSTVFPNVPVVIDKFHVLKMANTALDKVRTTLAKSRATEQGRQWMRDKALLRKRRYKLVPGLTGSPEVDGQIKLNSWLEGEPELKEAYELKEALADIYEPGTSKYEAEIALDKWRNSVPKRLGGKGKPFQPLLTATENWRTEILAYFDHRQTNAYTEGLNSVIKVKNRQGRGYGFDVLRARILFDPPPASWREIAESHTQLSPIEKRNLEQILRYMSAPSSEHTCWSCRRKFPISQVSVDVTNGREILVICQPCQDNVRNTAQSLQEASELDPDVPF